MKIKVFFIFLIAIFIISGFYCSSSKEGKGEGKVIVNGKPKIQVKNEKFDFGEVPDGTEVTHIYEISNAGTDTLIINDVETSCGCTKPELSKADRIIPPKGTSRIKITFNSRGRVGPNEKTITIFSNDPTEPNKNLLLVGRVLPKSGNTENK
jgi:hypothetical protein